MTPKKKVLSNIEITSNGKISKNNSKELENSEITDEDEHDEDENTKHTENIQNREVEAANSKKSAKKSFRKDSQTMNQKLSIILPKLFRFLLRNLHLYSNLSNQILLQLNSKNCSLPDKLPCREVEFDNILEQILMSIQDNQGTCLYISGVPGTGKQPQ